MHTLYISTHTQRKRVGILLFHWYFAIGHIYLYLKKCKFHIESFYIHSFFFKLSLPLFIIEMLENGHPVTNWQNVTTKLQNHLSEKRTKSVVQVGTTRSYDAHTTCLIIWFRRRLAPIRSDPILLQIMDPDDPPKVAALCERWVSQDTVICSFIINWMVQKSFSDIGRGYLFHIFIPVNNSKSNL